jgi:Ulp1 family protease
MSGIVIILQGYEPRLPFGALLTLADGQWVEGCVIDAFLDKLCNAPGQLAVKYFSCQQIHEYSQTFKIDKIERECGWNIADTHIILAPLHVHQNHWTLAVFNMDENELTVEVMDSSTGNPHTELAKRWGIGMVL